MFEGKRISETANELANRWFQPLTHVSSGSSPRVCAIAGQEVTREKRGLRGLGWHNARHSLIALRSSTQGIETRRAETLGSVHESPVAKGHAPKPPSERDHD